MGTVNSIASIIEGHFYENDRVVGYGAVEINLKPTILPSRE